MKGSDNMKHKRFIVALMAISLMLSILPADVFAEEQDSNFEFASIRGVEMTPQEIGADEAILQDSGSTIRTLSLGQTYSFQISTELGTGRTQIKDACYYSGACYSYGQKKWESQSGGWVKVWDLFVDHQHWYYPTQALSSGTVIGGVAELTYDEYGTEFQITTLRPGRIKVQYHLAYSWSNTYYDNLYKDNRTTTGYAEDILTCEFFVPGPQVTMTYDPCGGICSAAPKEVTFGQYYGTLPVPTRTDFEFVGWSRSQSYFNKVDPKDYITEDRDFTLFAHWLPKLKLSFDLNGAASTLNPIIVLPGQPYGTLPVPPSRSGYFFMGWYTDPVEGERISETDEVTYDSDFTLYAHWCTLYPNGGVLTEASNKALPVLKRSGYTFMGWFTEQLGGIKATEQYLYSLPKETELYAHWGIPGKVQSAAYGDEYYRLAAVTEEDRALWFSGEEASNGSSVNSTFDYIIDHVASYTYYDYNGTTTTGAAIREDGSLWMWGDNQYEQITTGKMDDTLGLTHVMDGVAEVSISNGVTAALRRDGSLWVWGNNEVGLMGNTLVESSGEPYRALDRVVSFRNTGWAIYAIREDKTLWAWGSNTQGALGNGSSDVICCTPRQILDEVASLPELGDYGVCFAIRTDNSLWSWGEIGSLLGRETAETWEKRIPGKVLDNVITFEIVDRGVAIATCSDGLLYIWGKGYSGLEGSTSSTPYRMDNVQSVVLGQFAAILKKDGTLWMCGYNSGQILNPSRGENSIVSTPQLMKEGIVSIYEEGGFNCAVDENGAHWIWLGWDYDGIAGDGSPVGTYHGGPIRWMNGFTSAFIRITGWGNEWSVCARKTDGTLSLWGRNRHGYLDSDKEKIFTSPVNALSDVASLSLNFYGKASAIKTDGSLWVGASGGFRQCVLPVPIYESLPLYICSDPGKVYDGQPVANPEAGGNAASATVTFAYFTDIGCTDMTSAENGGASSAGNAPVDPGTYWVRATATDREGNTITSDAYAFTIQEAPPRTVTFYANDGSAAFETQTTNAGRKVELKANTFIRSGYSFNGWNTKPDGSGVSYSDGAETVLTDNLALYAQWITCYEIVSVNSVGTTILFSVICPEDGVTVICASYGTTGQMMEVRLLNVEKSVNEKSYEINLSVPDYESIRLFMVDNHWKPLCAATDA